MGGHDFYPYLWITSPICGKVAIDKLTESVVDYK